jgi:hypothetical protein
MVRVLDDKLDPKVVKRTSCRRGCGSRLEYVPNDVKSRRYQDYGGGTDTVYEITCPKCGKAVEVSAP